jgi:ribosomal protein S18 acetylase RimI-like enzyme
MTPDSEIIVRGALPADIPGIVTLHVNLISDSASAVGGSFALGRYYRYLLQDTRCALFVASSNGLVVGFASLVDRQERALLRFFTHHALLAVVSLQKMLFSRSGIRYLKYKLKNELRGGKWGYAGPGDQNICELRSVAVSEAQQGRGTGRRMLAACIDEARSKEMRQMFAWISPDNVASQSLFRALGFREETRVQSGAGTDSILFSLTLSETGSSPHDSRSFR